jgi:beta-lactamase class C
MMIATLVDEGVLEWDTPAIEIYPEFKLPTEELTQSVTVRELMGMGTGLGTMTLSTIILLWDNFSATELLSALATFPVLSEKGHFHYNNQLYTSAAYLAAIAAGYAGEDLVDAYKSLMQARVFDPIGMESAVIADDPASVSDDYAVSYSFSLAGGPEALEKVPYAAINADAPAGGVIASVTDMARYLITQLQKGVSPDGVRAVSAENLSETWQPQTPITETDAPPWATPPASYGMGWIDERYGDVRILWHEGGTDAFSSEMAMLPEANAGIIILSNSSTGEWFNKAMRYSLIELLYDMEPQASAVVTAVFQGQLEELTTAAAMFASARVDAEAVAPYLGNYEHGWRVEQRDDETLWMVRPGWELQLLPTPDGYVVSSGNALGTHIGFAAGEDGKLKLVISLGGETTEVAKLP